MTSNQAINAAVAKFRAMLMAAGFKDGTTVDLATELAPLYWRSLAPREGQLKPWYLVYDVTGSNGQRADDVRAAYSVYIDFNIFGLVPFSSQEWETLAEALESQFTSAPAEYKMNIELVDTSTGTEVYYRSYTLIILI
jgi:hypothetical protein